jgi:hypothetical protein
MSGAGRSRAVPASQRRRMLQRRRLLAALGAGALGGALAGCATPDAPSPRPLDAAAAPRAGDTWRYAFRGAFRNPASRVLEVRVLEAGPAGVRDRITAEGEPDGEDHDFTSVLEMIERPIGVERRLIDRVVPRLVVVEFSPYLQAFGALPQAGPVAVPRPAFGPAFTGRAQLRGAERITVPAGSFDAVRIDYDISRTPSPTLRPRFDPVFILGAVWYAPAVKRPVRWTVVTRADQQNVIGDDLFELAAWRPA